MNRSIYNQILRAAMWFAGIFLAGCSADAWRGIATDAAVCTAERAAEEARRLGDLDTADRLDQIAMERVDAGAGGAGGDGAP